MGISRSISRFRSKCHPNNTYLLCCVLLPHTPNGPPPVPCFSFLSVTQSLLWGTAKCPPLIVTDCNHRQGAVDAVLMYERRSESALGYLLGRRVFISRSQENRVVPCNQLNINKDKCKDNRQILQVLMLYSVHFPNQQELHAVGRGLVRGDGLGGAPGWGGTAAGGAGRGAPSAAPRRR